MNQPICENNIMSTANDTQKCAACGTGGNGLKRCNGCKLVKYCNATCQKEHRPQQKKECKKRAAELNDEALFKRPPPRTECPICLLPLPIEEAEQTFQACCGSTLCKGCCYAVEKEVSHLICPFCRAPVLPSGSDEEWIDRITKRVDANDARAMLQLGSYYQRGEKGLPQDYGKAMELLLRAGELGCAAANGYVGDVHFYGEGVERDIKKAQHYWELAVIGGDVDARHNLGCIEAHAGNMNRAVKHWMMSAGAGLDHSLKKIREGFLKGYATKADFEKA